MPEQISLSFRELASTDVTITYHHAHVKPAMVGDRWVDSKVEVRFGPMGFGVEMNSHEAEKLGIQLIKGAL